MIFISLVSIAQSPTSVLSLNKAIEIAHHQSPQAQIVRLSLMAKYWNYRSYQAELRPTLNLGGTLGNYNRSLVEVRDPKTADVSYLENNSLTNGMTLSIDQNIPLTGGHLSLKSYAQRLDQYRYDKTTFNTNPLTINYSQPILAFNTLKWKKKTAPLEYDNAKRNYLKSMESITLQATNLFFRVLSSQKNYEKSKNNYHDRQQLFEIAQKRYKIGTITKSEILQLELSLLNAEMSINTAKLDYDNQLFNFCSFLGLKDYENITLQQPVYIPLQDINFNKVLSKAYKNSPHKGEQHLKLLQSKRALAQAKSNRGLQVDFNANLGLSQSANTFDAAYRNLKDREVVGLSFKLPLYDWGLGKGKIRMAKTDLEITKTEIEREELEFSQDIRTKVIRFNNQAHQCKISLRARDIAEKRYTITKTRFENGMVTVTELNTAQSEFDNALNSYMQQLQTYWSAYYEIQKLTLFDFIHNTDIQVEFDEILK